MPIALEREDKERDAAFNRAMHGKSAQDQGGIRAMMGLSFSSCNQLQPI
jgi:sterol 24-C-methyltransferase